MTPEQPIEPSDYDMAGVPDAVYAWVKWLEAAIEAKDAEIAEAYAKGFNGAEAEISATAVGQSAEAAHRQNAALRAEVARLRPLAEAYVAHLDDLFQESDESALFDELVAARAALEDTP